MEFTVFTAGKDDEDKRLDRVLKAILDGRPLGGRADGGARRHGSEGSAPDLHPATSVNIFQALRKKLIKLNGSKAEPSARVHEGDRIEIAGFLIAGTAGGEAGLFSQPAPDGASSPVSPPFPAAARPARSGSTQLEVLFQNDDLMFINKSAGISVQPSSGSHESISRIVRADWEAEGPRGSLSFIPAPLHRLDRYTSGVLAVSRSARGAAWFSKAIQERKIRKLYLGICQGRLAADELWEDQLTTNGENGTGFYTVQRAPVSEDSGEGNGSLARTRVHPVAYGRRGQDELTLVQYELLTGRKHQIRAQSALRGHPLYGDSAYGGSGGRTADGRASSGGRFFLHAFALEFPPDNPLSLPARIEAPLPEKFAKFVHESFPAGCIQDSHI